MIISISGASGVGKTTAIKNLTDISPRYTKLRSFTTRRNRPDDPPGEVCSVSDVDFEELASSGKFLWVVNIHGHKYGSLRSDLVDALVDTGVRRQIKWNKPQLELREGFAHLV